MQLYADMDPIISLGPHNQCHHDGTAVFDEQDDPIISGVNITAVWADPPSTHFCVENKHLGI